MLSDVYVMLVGDKTHKLKLLYVQITLPIAMQLNSKENPPGRPTIKKHT